MVMFGMVMIGKIRKMEYKTIAPFGLQNFSLSNLFWQSVKISVKESCSCGIM